MKKGGKRFGLDVYYDDNIKDETIYFISKELFDRIQANQYCYMNALFIKHNPTILKNVKE